MSKKVDNGIKKFWIYFFGFAFILDTLSIVLFNHGLLYYFNGTVEIYGGLFHDDFSMTYNNILRHSIVGKCLVPIILVCFFLFLFFTLKHVKKCRRYIYPIIFLLFLFVFEFIVLSFYDSFLPYTKIITNDLTVDSKAYTYIPMFHPFSFLSFIIYSFLIVIGNIFDSKSEGKKTSWYKIIIEMMIAFIVAVLINFVGNIIVILLFNG